MCGIAGFLSIVEKSPYNELVDRAQRMSLALRHRGPDDSGVWADQYSSVALSHRRLSVLELSSAGHQPMVSKSQRYVIAFNGEIYNHLQIRRELCSANWRGNSDTETILAAIEAWGIQLALQKFVGMFAFALWDKDSKELTLARDRMGEKPLFYGWQGTEFLFGSELKSLAAHPSWDAEVDQSSLTLFMRYGYVPLPHSIWRGVRKLLPGAMLVISANGLKPGIFTEPFFYWKATDEAKKSICIELDDSAATNKLEQILRTAIEGQMIADVPLGAFLSGGVDSSTVVALMQGQSNLPVRTFSIGFSNKNFDEAVYAKLVAQHLGTSHTEYYVSPNDALTVIPRLSEIYDEPFADSSQIPTYLVAALARREVTVSLSGDGGDELFGGYNRYISGNSALKHMGRFPVFLRQLVAQLLKFPSPSDWDHLGVVLPGPLRRKSLGDRVQKLVSILGAQNESDLYRKLISQIEDPLEIVVNGSESEIWVDKEAGDFRANHKQASFTERMMFQDLIGYLTDDILTKVDRAAMSVGLETRIPMLDHRVVSFAMSLPLHMKIRNGQGKWLLRQVLYRYVPKELIDRPKQGFGVPLGEWLRGPLRDWAENLLDESRLLSEGNLKPGPIRARWKQHLKGDRNWQYWLWNVLMYQAWREQWETGAK